MNAPTASAMQRFPISSDIDLHIAVARTPHLELLAGCPSVDRSMIATVVSELGRNILKYAQRGHIRLRRIETGGQVDVEIVAQDAGPGIADIDAAMQDHFSSGGTLGLGLPGVRRMVSEFSIQSEPGRGTCVTIRKRLNPDSEGMVRRAPDPDAVPGRPEAFAAPAGLACVASPMRAIGQLEIARRIRPCIAETVAGDELVAMDVAGGLLLAVIDTSGHGPEAHTLALRLKTVVETQLSRDLRHLMQRLHEVAQGTRGAAVGLAFLDPVRGTLQYLGVGNTRIVMFGDGAWRGVSREGVLGQRRPTLFEQSVPLTNGDVVLMFSDGIPELARRDLTHRMALDSAASIAQRLVQNHGKVHDDVACLVVKCKP